MTAQTPLLELHIRSRADRLRALLAVWSPARLARFDNRPTWDNRKSFDNRPGWDNWDKRR